jgi:hypothetical protein
MERFKLTQLPRRLNALASPSAVVARLHFRWLWRRILKLLDEQKPKEKAARPQRPLFFVSFQQQLHEWRPPYPCARGCPASLSFSLRFVRWANYVPQPQQTQRGEKYAWSKQQN